MKVKDVIRATKTDIDLGATVKSSRPGKSVFPLRKSGRNSIRLGAGYCWRLVKFSAVGERFRLLVAWDLRKEQYYAYLGMECGQDMRMLASYEFHGTHIGWHIHSFCGRNIDDVPVGRYKGDWKKRLPHQDRPHRATVFGVTEENALAIALDKFRIPTPGGINGQYPLAI